MIVAHLGDLHLGYRAFGRMEQGENARTRDVSLAFQRAVGELVRIRPDVVVFAGDVFDHPSPPASAMVSLTRGLETLRAAIPGVRLLLVAGRRDTPRAPSDPGPLAALDSLEGVDAVAGTPRSVQVSDLDAHFLLVPHRAVVARPWPELHPDERARWNVLVLRAAAGAPGASGSGVGSDPGGEEEVGGPLLDPASWDYVALGRGHTRREPVPGVHVAGSLERVGPDPWNEAAEEKGFLVWEAGEGVRFHPVQGRPVVDLAPIQVEAEDPVTVNDRIREVVEEIPGGLDGKIVRLSVEGLSPARQELLDREYLAHLRRRALHLHLELRPRAEPRSLGRSPPAAPTLEERLREKLGLDADGAAGGEARTRLDELLDMVEAREEAEGLEGTAGEDGEGGLEGFHPLVGQLSVPIPRGLVALVAEDHRVREALLEVADRDGVLAPVDRSHPGPVLRAGTELLTDPGGGRRLRRLLDRLGQMAGEGVVGPDDDGRDGPALPAALREEMGSLEERARRMEGAPRELRTMERELRDLRASAAETTGDVEYRTMEWLRERQDAETHLQAYRDRARELKARLRQIEAAGDSAGCPTCGRPLGERLEEVLAELRDEWESVVQDGQWWKRRREQLEEKPEHLRTLEGRAVRLQAAIEALAERLERRRAAAGEARELSARKDDIREILETLEEEDELPDEADLTPPPWVRRVERSLERTWRELRTEARERLLTRAGALLAPLSGGLYNGLVEGDDGLRFLQDGVEVPAISGADWAMATLATRSALALEMADAGSDPGLLVVGPEMDGLEGDPADRAPWVLRSLRDRVGGILVVTRGEPVDRCPEAFDAILEARRSGEEPGPLRFREVPTREGRIRLKGS